LLELAIESKETALKLLEDYSKSGRKVFHKEEYVPYADFDKRRIEVSKKINDLIQGFVNKRIKLEDFKREVDSINKREPLWGFRGMNGMMFFSQLYNCSKEKEEFAKILSSSIKIPADVNEAAEKIKKFVAFVKTQAKTVSDRRGAPKTKASLYFLSYFWQIQDHTKFPIFYNSIEQTFTKLGFMTPEENLDEYYVKFCKLNDALKDLFEKQTGATLSYWDLEHVFWYYYKKEEAVKPPPPTKINIAKIGIIDEHIPPVVSDIPLLAKNDEKLVEKYAKEGRRVEDVLEDKVCKLFIMLGYEVEKLGKGKGRVPDGIAKSRQDNYAILFDTKVRAEGYNLGTDDRTIIEYINSQTGKLRREGIRNIYYLIISSDFKGETADASKRIKLGTEVKEILLLKADLLLFMLELKLKDSLIGLGSDGLQQVFANGGAITKEDIQEYLVGR